MENKCEFRYSYSGSRNREIEKIRRKYIPREESRYDMLKRLDCRVRSAGVLSSLTVGIIGCLVFGAGICFMLGVFACVRVIPVILCVLGAALMISAYPLFKFFSGKARAELVPRILELSDEIINSCKE